MARPTGDFGRARESVLHDEILPAAGRLKAEHIDEQPVSKFNQTDQEREMHDRVWHFLTAAHAKDWTFDTSVEFQRARFGAADHRFGTDRYYRLISGDAYASSRVRYRTMADHIATDIDLLPTTFASICAVIDVDRQRGVAAEGLASIGPAMQQERLDRQAENAQTIGWFVRAVRYRYESYTFALEHLLVETPHEEAMRVDGRLSQLLAWVERAEQNDFCAGPGLADAAAGGGVRPRVLQGEKSDGPFRK